MKISILLRLSLGLGLAVFIFASALRASLDEILAPLPVAKIVVASAPVVELASEKTTDTIVTNNTKSELFAADAILSSDVEEVLRDSLEDALRPSGDLTLVPLRDLPDLSSHSQPFQINLVTIPNRLTRGNILVGFQVENEEGILGEWSVPFRVHLYSEVWYTRTRLGRGEIASPSDLESRRVDLLAEPDAVPASLESLLRREYSRDIQPGKPLTWGDLVERSLIRRGDVVEVSAVNGLLAITMRAIARQDGSDGDLILLRNIDSSKEFSAKVVGENRVEVVF
ncbi:flagellar basal body P-ring formation chaperone FlgA [Pelagicoccus albus]|uniref:Flagellar basal body P-ring formation protein FlgA n=1 Tax=Pelagicoccus albus TaxID=415222 RepID=A0A7X1B7X1_9BACT|nr:flagellar basal body P-ring formation chaperone FlgA [Pelagicoccus albus]MBC2606030.1 flagellar basal body P-ring formation protein FlgA [Pelagicoccus albus]